MKELRELVEKLPARIINKILFSGRCWRWMGAINSNGYGCIWWNNKTEKAHKVIYELIHGPIESGFILDHLCRNKYCVNPNHLEPVTWKENIHRGIGPSAVNAKKTHCPSGHPYSKENTSVYIHKGYTQRNCKACLKIKNDKRKKV